MAELSFSLVELFEKSFGYRTNAFDPDFGNVQGLKPGVRAEQGAHGSPYYAKDTMGVEYFLPVTLAYSDNGSAGSGQLKKWNLPYPVISISSRKTIIETPLTERRGTVKELINIEDYDITVKGFIISASNDLAEDAITTLRTIYEQNTPLSIQCPLTDIFLLRPDRSGSDQVALREIRFPTIVGVKNIRPYELHFVSDEPFNLVSIS
jgi:hypothetical protein